MYFITIKRMLEVCFSAHPNIQYRAKNILTNIGVTTEGNKAMSDITNRLQRYDAFRGKL